MRFEYQRIEIQWTKFSHLLTVRAEVADPSPPSPPFTVSLTENYPFLTPSLVEHELIIYFRLCNKLRFNEVTVSSNSQDLGTCQQPSRLTHNTKAPQKHSFSNSSQSLISHGSYFREDLIPRNLRSCSSSLIVLRYIYINIPKTPLFL